MEKPARSGSDYLIVIAKEDKPKFYGSDQTDFKNVRLGFLRGLGRAADCSTALLQTRASAINAHGSSDYGFAESFIAMHDPWGH